MVFATLGVFTDLEERNVRAASKAACGTAPRAARQVSGEPALLLHDTMATFESRRYVQLGLYMGQVKEVPQIELPASIVLTTVA